MNSKQQQAIDRILDNFDFKIVKTVMDFLKWKWYSTRARKMVIPDIPEIKSTARRLLIEAANDPKKNSIILTGGLLAEKIDGHFFQLSFVVTDYYDDIAEDSKSEKKEKREKRKIKRTEVEANSAFFGLEI